jgi:hypothetical protein
MFWVMSLVFVKHPFNLDHILRTRVFLERLWSLESKFCVQFVQNLFLVIWFDSYIALHMLNRIIQAFRCLTYENLFKINFLVIQFDSCIFGIESFKLSYVWLMKIDFESIQIILNLFNIHLESFELVQGFSESIHLNWFKVSLIILNLRATRISYFTLLNQFKTFLIRLKPIFSVLFWVNLLLSHLPIYTSIQRQS